MFEAILGAILCGGAMYILIRLLPMLFGGSLYDRRLDAFNRRFAHLSFDERQDLMRLLVAKRRIKDVTSAAVYDGIDHMKAYREAVEEEAGILKATGRHDLAKTLISEAADSADIMDPQARKIVLRETMRMAKAMKRRPDRAVVEALNILD